ncbi:hypothetical protein QYE76_040805 [Lolium multiflorum]|uniref:Uncharacterized protein n=1 Tax=Lolium multiflorum TaxID=4521 RepID=A0AAD8TDN8_LOLMU|nr:hypothetical protein QYE76_040805 [Lolium multiflorum]
MRRRPSVPSSSVMRRLCSARSSPPGCSPAGSEYVLGVVEKVRRTVDAAIQDLIDIAFKSRKGLRGCSHHLSHEFRSKVELSLFRCQALDDQDFLHQDQHHHQEAQNSGGAEDFALEQVLPAIYVRPSQVEQTPKPDVVGVFYGGPLHDALGRGRVGEATSGTSVTGHGSWSSPKLARSNEHTMADIAMILGFDVRVGEMDINIDVSMLVWLVNSTDVMVSMHGARLTKVFLLARVVLIQEMPYGSEYVLGVVEKVRRTADAAIQDLIDIAVQRFGRVSSWMCVNFVQNVQDSVATGFCREPACMCQASAMTSSSGYVHASWSGGAICEARFHDAMAILGPQHKELKFLIEILLLTTAHFMDIEDDNQGLVEPVAAARSVMHHLEA